jgi:hypothetical protein
MHGENSLSLAGEVSTTDPELLSHRVLIKGSDVEQKGIGDAPERLALLSSINSWRWSRATDEVRASKHARSSL